MTERFYVDVLSLSFSEIVTVLLAPFTIRVYKSLLRKGANALTMPEMRGEVNPLLVPVTLTRLIIWACMAQIVTPASWSA